MWAAEDAMVELLMKAGSDVNVQNSNGNTALMEAAGGGHTAMVELLLKAGADVNAKNKFGGTALMWAAGFGHTAMVERLLKAGADSRATDKDGHNALWHVNQNKKLSGADKKRVADMLWDAMMK